jgi:hypothetical protein
MGIIHMNGRLYDPLIARFMSADPFIQAPGNLQSYNRYAYVMNNPLNLTDPSGYSAWTRIRGFVVAVVAAVADAYGCAGYCSQAVQYYNYAKTAQAYYNAYQQGGWSAVGKSYLRSTLSDMVGQAAFGGSGDVGVGQEYGFEHYAATAAAGCVSSVASGGKCGSGAAAAVAGKFATQMTDGGDLNSQTRYFIAQAAGGLASEVAGGKFANGAQTAAYGYLFNELQHYKGTPQERLRLAGYEQSPDYIAELAFRDLRMSFPGEYADQYRLAPLAMGGNVTGFASPLLRNPLNVIFVNSDMFSRISANNLDDYVFMLAHEAAHLKSDAISHIRDGWAPNNPAHEALDSRAYERSRGTVQRIKSYLGF